MHPYYKKALALAGAVFLFAGLLAALANTGAASATTADELREQIEERTQQLQEVNQELEATQGQLSVVQNQKNTLQTQVQSLDTSIKQLNLNIRKDQLTAANLQDEIVNLQSRLAATGVSIEDKKQAITATLQELQQQDNTSLILVVLAQRSLTAGLADAQLLGNLRTQLTAEVGALQDLSEEYIQTLEDLGVKRSDVVVNQKNLESRKVIVEDQKKARATLLTETKNQESIYQQKVNALRAQQDALQDEVERIEAQLRAGVDTSALPGRQEGLFSWPLQNIRITQHYGERSSLYRGKPHNGLDFGAPIGTPVLAVADGVVTAAGNNDRSATAKYQYGKYVLIKHANDLTTLYAHLSRQAVAAGSTVSRGQIIGYSGSTGYSTGPHMHLGVYYTPSVSLQALPPAAGLVPVGVTLRPESYLPAF